MLNEVLKIWEEWPAYVKANIKQKIKDLVTVSYKFV